MNLHAYKEIATAAIIPAAVNPRTHSPAQVEQLRASIREFGFTNPVLVDEDNRLIAGHGRLQAALAEGLTHLPAIELKGLTQAQKRALVIADNQLAANAGWNADLLTDEMSWLQGQQFDLTVIGFDAQELALWTNPGGGTRRNRRRARGPRCARSDQRHMPEMRRDLRRARDVTVLRLDWVGFAGARLACERWHYSGSIPSGKLVKVGAWEDSQYIGVVIFSRGATPNIGSPYGLAQTQICELTRVALTHHKSCVSRIMAIALRLLQRQSPGMRLVVSFADAGRGHHGGIYQAGGWVYAGGDIQHAYRINGNLVHPKTLYSAYGRGGQSIPWLRTHIDPNAARVETGFKQRYLMPLTPDMQTQISALSQPYPKRVKQATDVTNVPAAGQHRPTRSNSTTSHAEPVA